MLRTAVPGLLLLCVLLVPAACSDNGPSDSAGIVPLSCGALRELAQYQYKYELRLEAPSPSGTINPEPELEPRDALGLALDGELSAFGVSGLVTAPGAWSQVFRYGEQEVELRRIGDETWTRFGSEFIKEPLPDRVLPSAESICDAVKPVIEGVQTGARPDSTFVFGSETQHYQLNLRGREALRPLFGESSSGDYTVDLWLAKNGRWPAQIVIQSNNGEPEASYRLALEVTDANDVSLRVGRP